MTCDYFTYKNMMNELFYGVALTEQHLNKATETIRKYLVEGGAGDVINSLRIGIKVVSKKALLLPTEVIKKRFVWLDGERKGEELDRGEIEGIGLFLKHGAFYKD